MKGSKTLLMVIIFLLLVAVGWACQVGLSAEQTVFDNDYYRGILDETGLDSHIYGVMQDRLQEGISAEMPDNLAYVVTMVLSAVFNEEWVGKQILVLTDDIVLYLRGEQPSLQAAIDLREKKDQLRVNLENALTVIPDQILFMLGFDPQQLDALVGFLVYQLPLPDQLAVEELLAAWDTDDRLIDALAKIRQYQRFYGPLSVTGFALLLFAGSLLVGPFRALKWFGAAAVVSGLGFYLALQAGNYLYPVLLDSGFMEGRIFAHEIFIPVLEFSVNRIVYIPVYYALAGLAAVLLGTAADKISGSLLKRGKNPAESGN